MRFRAISAAPGWQTAAGLYPSQGLRFLSATRWVLPDNFVDILLQFFQQAKVNPLNTFVGYLVSMEVDLFEGLLLLYFETTTVKESPAPVMKSEKPEPAVCIVCYRGQLERV